MVRVLVVGMLAPMALSKARIWYQKAYVIQFGMKSKNIVAGMICNRSQTSTDHST